MQISRDNSTGHRITAKFIQAFRGRRLSGSGTRHFFQRLRGHTGFFLRAVWGSLAGKALKPIRRMKDVVEKMLRISGGGVIFLTYAGRRLPLRRTAQIGPERWLTRWKEGFWPWK